MDVFFEQGEIYRRRHLHDRFGGQQQGGISTPSKHALILLFTGDTGEQYGYRDGRQADGTFLYSGEGQIGDMKFTRGNRTIREHESNGKSLYLFEKVEKGFVRYIGEFMYVRHELTSNVPDHHGRSRTAIKFLLSPMDQ